MFRSWCQPVHPKLKSVYSQKWNSRRFSNWNLPFLGSICNARAYKDLARTSPRQPIHHDIDLKGPILWANMWCNQCISMYNTSSKEVCPQCCLLVLMEMVFPKKRSEGIRGILLMPVPRVWTIPRPVSLLDSYIYMSIGQINVLNRLVCLYFGYKTLQNCIV